MNWILDEFTLKVTQILVCKFNKLQLINDTVL